MVDELPGGLGPGVPQEDLKEGADYEVLIGATNVAEHEIRPDHRVISTGEPYYPSRGGYSANTVSYSQPIRDYYSHSQPSRDYYSHAEPYSYHDGYQAEYSVASPPTIGPATTTKVYYQDEFGNRIPGPGETKEEAEEEESHLHSSSSNYHQDEDEDDEPGVSKPHPVAYSSSSHRPVDYRGARSYDEPSGPHPVAYSPATHRPVYSQDTGVYSQETGVYSARSGHQSSIGNRSMALDSEVFDRLSQPKKSSKGPKEKEVPAKARVPNSERQSTMERLTTPKQRSAPEEECFDPNLRTVYRKMDPEDLDQFVYRMYAPYKNPTNKRDVYDEQKAMEKKLQKLRSSPPRGRPDMDFSRASPGFDASPKDHGVRPPTKLPANIKAEAHDRLYQQAAAHREKRKLLQNEKFEQEAPHTGSRKLTPSQLQELLRHLSQNPPPPQYEHEGYIGDKILTEEQANQMVKRLSTRPPKPSPPPMEQKRQRKLDEYEQEALVERLSIRPARLGDPPVHEDPDNRRRTGPEEWKYFAQPAPIPPIKDAKPTSHR